MEGKRKKDLGEHQILTRVTKLFEVLLEETIYKLQIRICGCTYPKQNRQFKTHDDKIISHLCISNFRTSVKTESNLVNLPTICKKIIGILRLHN